MAEAHEPLEADEPRLLKLEEKVAYQDKLVAELNEVVVALHRRVDELRARLDSAEHTVRQELEGRDVANEKPPHY
jgi:SlyX protein